MSRKDPEAGYKQILCRDTKQSCCDIIKTATPEFCHDSIKFYHDRTQVKAQK